MDWRINGRLESSAKEKFPLGGCRVEVYFEYRPTGQIKALSDDSKPDSKLKKTIGPPPNKKNREDNTELASLPDIPSTPIRVSDITNTNGEFTFTLPDKSQI